MWSNVGKSEGLLPFRETLGPICLMIVTFFLAPLFVHSNNKLDGSLWTLGEKLYSEPIATVVSSFFGEEDGRQDRFSKAAIFLFIFSAFEIALQQLVPGKPYHGPITPKGHIPVYKANGFQCFILTVLAFLLVPAFLGESSPFQRTIIAEIYPELITILCIGSFFFCGWLYVKGHVAPSGPDSGTSGNAVIDFYWGMELYPRVGSWDVKLFTNCRFGLMLWVLAPISFAAQQMISHPVGDDLGYGGLSYAMAVNVALQLAYLTKFYVWETGYLSTIDIMHDRAGYYICWGCLVWVPSVYVSHSYYISQQTENNSLFGYPITAPVAAALFLIGFICIAINYDADRQRSLARSTDGDCIIWGKKATIQRVKYVTETGETKSTMLLTSGWWGVSRHFHYVPEILASLFWALPAGSKDFMPYVYVAFLTILLLDRGNRDDARMKSKYNNKHGQYFDEYCKVVPYLFIPGIY